MTMANCRQPVPNPAHLLRHSRQRVLLMLLPPTLPLILLQRVLQQHAAAAAAAAVAESEVSEKQIWEPEKQTRDRAREKQI